MQQDMIFFSDKGLTSTSANYIANLAKEYIQKHESILNNISFYTEEVTLIGTSNSSILHTGISDISNISTLLKEVAEAKSLIAWLREAIKAKERLSDEWEAYAEERYLGENNITMPVRPVIGHILTEEEYYSNLSIKERNRYYSLETEAAVLGKYIHPDGKFSEARKALSHCIQNPHKVSGNGRDTIIYSYTPTIESSKVDDLFFALQQKHREVQAQLNSIKYECEQAIIASRTKVQEEYTKALQQYNSTTSEIQAKIAEYKTKKLKEVGNYKIIIPDSLKAIYEKVSKLGK